MKKVLCICVMILTVISCGEKKSNEEKTSKIPVYAWTGGPGNATDQELVDRFLEYKEKGIDGLMYNGGHDPETYKRVGALVKNAGMEFHA